MSDLRKLRDLYLPGLFMVTGQAHDDSKPDIRLDSHLIALYEQNALEVRFYCRGFMARKVFTDPGSDELKKSFIPTIRVMAEGVVTRYDEAMRREYGM